MTQEVIFAGFGGQGILSIVKFLDFGAMDAGMNVSWCPSYGPEMRGGTANCSVILSDEEIGAPIITAPDTILVMNRPSLDKFEPTVKPGGLIIIDSNLVTRDVTRDDVTVISIPAQDIAAAIGSVKIANMVLLGALVAKTGVISVEALLESLRGHGKEAFFEMNKAAIDKGVEYANTPVMA